LPAWLPVHLFLLGAVTNAIITWTEHFTVALMRLPATSDRYQAGRLAILNTGIAVLVTCAVTGPTHLAVVGALTVLGVIIVHTVWLAACSRRALSGRFGHVGAWYTGAGGSSVLGALPGPTGPETHQRLIAAHVHMNLWGWVGLAVLGSLFTLWPTILRTKVVDGTSAVARRCLFPALLGLATAAGGLAVGAQWVAVTGLTVY